MPNKLIIGQEVVVSNYCLGRVIAFTPTYIEVKPYMTENSIKADPCDIKVVELKTIDFYKFIEQD